jgi:hypothetical protein
VTIVNSSRRELATTKVMYRRTTSLLLRIIHHKGDVAPEDDNCKSGDVSQIASKIHLTPCPLGF